MPTLCLIAMGFLGLGFWIPAEAYGLGLGILAMV
jgi:hypothetical protein